MKKLNSKPFDYHLNHYSYYYPLNMPCPKTKRECRDCLFNSSGNLDEDTTQRHIKQSIVFIIIFCLMVTLFGLFTKFAYVDYQDHIIESSCNITSCQETNTTCISKQNSGVSVEYTCYQYCLDYIVVSNDVSYNRPQCTNYGDKQNLCNQSTSECYYIDNPKSGRFDVSIYNNLQKTDQSGAFIGVD